MLAIKTTELTVADYMTPRPITVNKGYSLQDAVNLMAEHDIGNLVIEERRKPIGILTEREILSHLVNHKKIQNISVGKIKPTKFVAINLQSRIIDAAKIMISQKSRLLVFDDNKKFVGIITATDMVRSFRRTTNNPDLDEFVSKKLYSVKYDKSVLEACKIMNDKRIGSVIVTKDDQPFGMFTERDLLVNVLLNESDVQNPVGGYCTSPLITVGARIKGSDAAKIMSKHNIKRLGLTKGKKLFGIVTARDIVDAFQWSFGDET